MTDIILDEDHNHSDTELPHEAKELVLFGDNSSHLEHTSRKPIVKALARKIKKGTYDHGKATKLWGHHADKAAQEYTKQYGHAGQKYHEMFAPKHRKAAAKHWADEHHEGVMSGDQSHVYKEDVDLASEIVFAAMGKKPVDVNVNFKEAILERSKELIDDQKCEMAGHFITSFDEARKPKPGSPGGSWVDRAVADRFKKQGKEKKQFASAKREIDQLKKKGK